MSVNKSSRFYHDQHHLEPRDCLQGMRFVGGHYDHLALIEARWISRDRNFYFTVEDIYESIKGGRMFA
jgi:hypothetical protein